MKKQKSVNLIKVVILIITITALVTIPVVLTKKDGKFTLIYNIGDSIIFNPGDGDRTWNIIGEDSHTVTLMLTENLGNPVAWYLNLNDNNYGPKEALDYLNSLTTNWDNVDPIKNYSYVNNLNGTTKTNGYQKIEIKDEFTTLTHKNGANTTLKQISKARLITQEEIFEIAANTNKNLIEDNLKAYIERNLASINTEVGISVTTVDEAIKCVAQEYGIKNESKYMQTYMVVLLMIYDNDIEPTYDILLPKYLYQNLNDDQVPYAYWILSSSTIDPSLAWYVSYEGDLGYGAVSYKHSRGIRPVITVLKSNL